MEQTPNTSHSVIDLVAQAGPIVQLVLLLLLLASVLCWAIIFLKIKTVRSAHSENNQFLKLFWKSKSLDDVSSKASQFKHSPISSLFLSGHRELKKLSNTDRTEDGQLEVENIERALARATNYEVASLEKHVSWLATTASAAPFIGLFGTVWGIMNSFQMIGASGAANLAIVAPGISEALIATAVGLAAAIPAAIAYNFFIYQIKKLVVDMDCFSQDFLNIVQRGFLGGGKQ